MAEHAGPDGVLTGHNAASIGAALGWAEITIRRSIMSLVQSGDVECLHRANARTKVWRVTGAPRQMPPMENTMTVFVPDRRWSGGGHDTPMVAVTLPRVRCLER